MGCDSGELSVLFTDDRHISALNREYRGKDGPTNVLAFRMWEGRPPEGDCGMMGDVVVSVETAVRESRDLDEPVQDTVRRLLIHGILHLFGYDHERSRAEARCMEKEETRLLGLTIDD